MPSRGDDVNQAGREIPADLPRVDFFHWLLADVPVTDARDRRGRVQHAASRRAASPGPAVTVPGFERARQGVNDFTGWFAGNPALAGDYFGYDGPYPPWNDSLVHHYVFTLYALVGGARAGRRPLRRRRAAQGDRRPRPRRGDALGTYTLNRRPRLVSRSMGAPNEVTRIVAVRHGETDWNAEMRMQGQLDTALSERGRWQAARAAEALAGEGIEAIFASDLVRAYDTAKAIAAVVGLPIATDTGLRERSFGIFQGHTYAEIDARWPADAARWRRHDPAFAPEGGESLVEFSARAVAAVTRIAERARGHARSSSSATAACSTACTAPRRASTSARRARGSSATPAINRLLFTGERFTLVGWSDTAHLDGDPLDDGSEGDCPTVPRVAT